MILDTIQLKDYIVLCSDGKCEVQRLLGSRTTARVWQKSNWKIYLFQVTSSANIFREI